MPVSQEPKQMEFEPALKRLEELVEKLENGELSLEEALKAYEEGVRMADACSKRLAEAEKKVEVLLKTQGSKAKTAPFDENAAAEPKKRK
jgi:exodeoxyribonuclease VII small subunit